MAKTVESIGKYKVTSQLASGGMGAVYIARHPTLDRSVIIKKLTLRGNAAIRERFRREAQIMMDLRNDAIVDVYDHFREGSSYYIVLEYVEGVSLETLIRSRRYLPDAIALIIIREVCRGLAYAHARRVVHRDIKPANILISKTGEIKLVDFGIATIHGEEGGSDLTRDGMTLGTPSYMAPEQFQNTRSVDARADIYSLGVALYEMVTGKRPYPGSFSPEVIARIQRGRYRSPRAHNPRISLFVSRLIARMLKPKAERRLTDLGRLIRRINRRYRLGAPEEVHKIIATYLETETSAVIPRKRKRLPAIILAVVLPALAVLGVDTYRNGYHRELIYASSIGALDVSVRVRAGTRDPDTLHLSGSLYRDEENEREQPPYKTLRLYPQNAGETDLFDSFRSDRLLVEPGRYRLKITAPGIVWWESVQVVSLAAQSGSRFVIPGRPESGRQVRIDLIDEVELPLAVRTIVRDEQNGRVIEDSTIEIFEGDEWFPLTLSRRQRLRSGRDYRLRISHPDFRPQIYELAIQPHESTVVIESRLTPKE